LLVQKTKKQKSKQKKVRNNSGSSGPKCDAPCGNKKKKKKKHVRTASPSCGSAGFKAETTAERKTSKEWRGRLQKQQKKQNKNKQNKKQGLGDDDDLGSFFF